MTDYPYLFEQIILAAWEKDYQDEDPYKLGNADVLGVIEDKLSGEEGRTAKFALSSAIRKVAADKRETALEPMLLKLDEQICDAKLRTDLYPILDKSKELFESVGIRVSVKSGALV